MMRLEESRPVNNQKRQLSNRQRRDLLELTAAGVISVLFVATPLFLIGEGARSTAQPQVRQPIDAAIPPRVQIVTTDVAATVSTPALEAFRPVVPGVRRAALVRPREKAASVRARVPIGRRLVRLFAGDGTHMVRPFPTLPGTER
jgi:hypothetical protein